MYGPTVNSACQNKNQAKISAALKVLMEEWKKFENTKTLPRAGSWAKLSN
jgi:hypothetical protein